MKKFAAFLMCLCMLATMAIVPAVAEVADGTYEGTGAGFGGDLKVKVTVAGGEMESIEIVESAETEGVADAALEAVPQYILDNQTLTVPADTMTGATFAGSAVIEAVTNAMTEAGADIEALKAAAPAAEEETAPAAEDTVVECDVVVVGAGGAGLAAAVEAGKAGAKVVVVEKMPKVGGNTLICGSGYNAVDPKRQDPMGIEDSVELFVEQTLKGGDNEGNPELVQIMCEKAYEGVEFLESYGMEWQDVMSTAPGGLYQRRHMPANGALGVPMINALTKGCEENGVEVMVDTKATEIIMVDGKAAGVVCEGKDGAKVIVNAAKGVVIATGGFGANVEMRQEYNTIWPTLDDSVLTTNHPGATGDGIVMAKAAGADLVDMQFIQLFPYGDPKTGAMTGSIMKQPENAVYLNKEGLRFVNEYERRDVVSAAILEQTDSQMFVIVDGKTYPDDAAPTDFGTTIGEELEAGRSVKGETIEELAANLGMDPAVVKKSIDDYNAGVDAKADAFGKDPMNKIDTAPFYANPRTPTVHHTMGGIKINTDAQVVGTDGNPIPGLFAAGETTGDIHGTNRVGANALPDIIVFGRIAGQNAAK